MLRFIALLLFVVHSSNLFGQSEKPGQTITDSTGPQFNFFNKDRAHDFGSIMINGNAEYKFEFKNSGNQALLIKEMHSVVKGINTPPYKVLINYPKDPIKPGKKGIITALVVAQGNTGSFKCEVHVTSNATTANYPLLLLTGAIVPDHGGIAPEIKEPVIPIEFLTPIIGTIAN